ncbi:diguanylate cyclase [Pararhodospirillum oryzae]|nr:diguanylate cyclase [Pararhodospirillum oryzae]
MLWSHGAARILALLGALGAVSLAARATAAQAPPPGEPAATVCVDPDWPPYDSLDAEGNHEGIGADLLRLAAERAGVALTVVPTRDWNESLAASHAGRCDILSFLNDTPQRREWLVFTDPLFIDPNVVVTHEDHAFIPDLAALTDETMALPEGTAIEERVRQDFPNLRIVTTRDEAEAFALVSKKKADMTMRSLTVAVYTIKKEGWFNLKIAGQVPGYENQLRLGIRKDKEALRERLDIGVHAVSAAERARIANSHVAIKAQMGIDTSVVAKVIGVFSVIVLSNLFWIGKLRHANRRLLTLSRTDSLTGLANRAHLNERFARELDRATRYGRPLSLIMIDIDHFKRINDAHGHLEGDRTLVALAGLTRANTRATDIVGRWGGEEFLILCPETDLIEARNLAERLRQAIRKHLVLDGEPTTLSAGVATLGPGDTQDSVLRRADEALYRAKNEGRDRVCTSPS